MQTFTGVDEVVHAVGTQLGETEWLEITQEQVNQFAEATGDHQWIHVDPAAAARGPFGTTIAHGYLMLSMIPMLASEVSRVEGVRMGINYGLNRVRFPAPLPTGSPLRAGVRLVSVDDVAGGVQVVSEVTLEREGGDKPCCVAETVARYYTAEP
jgi:acyl dehydratase